MIFDALLNNARLKRIHLGQLKFLKGWTRPRIARNTIILTEKNSNPRHMATTLTIWFLIVARMTCIRHQKHDVL